MEPTNSQNQDDDPMIGKLIFDRYRLIKRLGAGSFGSIYSAEYENNLYAIKLEEKRGECSLLEHESYIMSHLRGPALPSVKIYGYSRTHNILVMELMGKSLEDLFEEYPEKKFSVRCVCNIGYQMIEILEYIHNRNIIHRDIKPDNFVIGLNEKRKYIYILDFGLSKKYRNSKTLKHYTIIKSKNLTGTARYASIHALNGLTQSRRDDLEAVGYVLLYFLRGRLPWQGIPVRTKEERYKKIMDKKLATSAEELCQGFPQQFTDFINYTRQLQYEQDPDYYYLKNLFLIVLNNQGFKIDCYYDWDKQTIIYNRNFNAVEKNNNEPLSTVDSIKNLQPVHVGQMNGNQINKNKTDNNNLQNNNVSISNKNMRTNYYNGSTINEASTLYQRVGNDNTNNNNSSAKNISQVPYKSNLASNCSKSKPSKNYEQNIAETNTKNEEKNKKEWPEGMNPRPEKEDKCCCSIF